MRNKIFFVGNANRKPEFRISTFATINDEDKVEFAKRAETNEARIHIAAIGENFNKIQSIIKNDKINIVQPLSIASNSEQISFPRVEGQRLETILMEALHNDNREKIVEILEEYKRMIDLFTTEFIPDTNNIFCNSSKLFDSDDELCLNIYDSHLNNIIVDDNQWTLIDYEFLFNFSIPKRLLIARALYIFCMTYNETLRFAIDQIDVVDLGAILYPKIFLEYASIKDLNDALLIEMDFQEYIIGSRPKYKELIEVNPPRKPELGVINELQKYVIHLENDIASLTEYIDTANTKIITMENSRLVRLGKVANRVKNKLPLKMKK
jgi:hypothetical protein